MSLTKRDKRKLAKAARELASAFAEGRGPRLSNDDFCGCAIGQVLYGGDRSKWASDEHSTAFYLDLATDGILTEATGHELGHEIGIGGRIPGAVVFPLLWLADELEPRS